MNVLIPEDAIRERVREIAAAVNADFGERLFTVVGILTGSLVFLADLIRRLEHRHQIGLLEASSYRGTATTAGTTCSTRDCSPKSAGGTSCCSTTSSIPARPSAK